MNKALLLLTLSCLSLVSSSQQPLQPCEVKLSECQQQVTQTENEIKSAEIRILQAESLKHDKKSRRTSFLVYLISGFGSVCALLLTLTLVFFIKYRKALKNTD